MRAPVLILAAVLLTTAPAFAQPKPVERALSDKEKADEATAHIGTMREVLTRVTKLIDEARNDRDALRLNCINERKAQISGLVKVAELALEELRAAAKERQSEAVDHEFNKIKIARGKVDGYKTEADQCIGALAYFEGDEVERQFYDENTDTAKLDPTTAAPLEPTNFRPPPASPVK